MNKKDKSWPRLTSHTAPSLTFLKNKTKQREYFMIYGKFGKLWPFLFFRKIKQHLEIWKTWDIIDGQCLECLKEYYARKIFN